MISPGAKILIAGCGSIGSVFGCLLKCAGHDVTLLGREWHLGAVRSGGLQIDGLWGDHQAKGFSLATQSSEISHKYDLIFIAVKAHSTVDMVQQVHRFLHPDGLAVSLQNGLGNIETLAGTFGPARSFGSSILVGTRISAPGRVTVTVQAAPVVIGPLDPTHLERTRTLVETLRHARIPCEPSEQILGHLWAKVFYNAPLNPLGALLGVHYGALAERTEVRALMDRIIDEAFAVATKQSARLFWQSAQEYRKLFYGRLLPATQSHQSSMLQDLELGRKTEIAALNGRIWEYGRSLGVATPFNEIVTRLIWASEERGPMASHFDIDSLDGDNQRS